MKILIIGNIASGKTTLGMKIGEMLDIPLVEIDKIREKYLIHGRVSEEYLCLYHFLRHAESDENVILEFTGVGCHKYAVRRALELSGHKVLVIVCRTDSPSINLQRLKSKNYSYAHPFDIDINKHVFFVEKELIRDLESGFWELKNFTVLEVPMNTPDDIERNIEKIKAVLRAMINSSSIIR